MRRMASPGSPSSLASSEGLVVAPESTPHAAISSTSLTEPVSMKSLMGSRLALGPDSDPFEALVVGVEVRNLRLPAQDRADGEQVGRGADVVHADHRGAR